MQNRTPETWQARADRLGIRVPTIAQATGASRRSVAAYRQGKRRPSTEWLAKVDTLLTRVEDAVSQAGVAEATA